MTTKKKIVKKQKQVTLPLKQAVGIFVIALALTFILVDVMLSRSISPTGQPTRWSFPLPTMTAIPSRTPIPIFISKTATPFIPILDPFQTPNVQFFVMTKLQIADRGAGKVMYCRDITGIVYPGTLIETKKVATLTVGSYWYIEEAIPVGNDIWGRLASQDAAFCPLYFNGVYFTNWRKP